MASSIAHRMRIPDAWRWPEVQVPGSNADALAAFLARHPKTLLLTGAGISAASGIPAYRDAQGTWQRARPMQYQRFMSSEANRRRYWARSYLGWPRMRLSRPNDAHHALARLQAAGIGGSLVTQNVDGLHQRAGSSSVIELHGSLGRVVCQDCGHGQDRQDWQAQLRQNNRHWHARVQALKPDGDAELDDSVYASFQLPGCPDCDGRMKPDVVFFGENVPADRVHRIRAQLRASDAVLVVGSSLAVWSGFRFVREAHEAGLPVAAINQGRTRADPFLRFKVVQPCQDVLRQIAGQLL